MKCQTEKGIKNAKVLTMGKKAGNAGYVRNVQGKDFSEWEKGSDGSVFSKTKVGVEKREHR